MNGDEKVLREEIIAPESEALEEKKCALTFELNKKFNDVHISCLSYIY